MDEPDLHVTTHPKWAPACESGQHIAHPFYECDEVDLLSAAFDKMIEGAFAEAFSAANQIAIVGNGSGDMRGFLGLFREPAEPTPIERALDILEPELRRCPLYRPVGWRLPHPA